MRERDGRTCAVSLTAQSVSVRSLEVNSYSAAEKQQPVFTEKNCIKTNENIRIMNWSYVKKFKVTFALVFCVWLLLECCVWGNFEVCGEESRWPVFVASKLTLNLIEVFLKGRQEHLLLVGIQQVPWNCSVGMGVNRTWPRQMIQPWHRNFSFFLFVCIIQPA